jgi:hypothetical protein
MANENIVWHQHNVKKDEEIVDLPEPLKPVNQRMQGRCFFCLERSSFVTLC